jgi:hypothetical protein
MAMTVSQRMSLPRVTQQEYERVFNSTNTNCESPHLVEYSHGRRSEAVIVDNNSRPSPHLLPLSKLNTVNLRLMCESPRRKVRKIIHNKPRPLNSSLEIIRKIERKRKQTDLINRM